MLGYNDPDKKGPRSETAGALPPPAPRPAGNRTLPGPIYSEVYTYVRDQILDGRDPWRAASQFPLQCLVAASLDLWEEGVRPRNHETINLLPVGYPDPREELLGTIERINEPPPAPPVQESEVMEPDEDDLDYDPKAEVDLPPGDTSETK